MPASINALFLSSAASGANAIQSIGRNNALPSPAYHHVTACGAFATTRAVVDARTRLARTRLARTRLAAGNSGMDAYEAQMAAAMGAASNVSPPATTMDGSAIEESRASSASSSKWTGRNSYAQHLLLEKPVHAHGSTGYCSNSYNSQYSTSNNGGGTDSYAQTMSAQSLADKEDANGADLKPPANVGVSASSSNEDAYEMQFTKYLLSLQREPTETANIGEQQLCDSPFTEESADHERQDHWQPRQSSPSTGTPSTAIKLDEEPKNGMEEKISCVKDVDPALHDEISVALRLAERDLEPSAAEDAAETTWTRDGALSSVATAYRAALDATEESASLLSSRAALLEGEVAGLRSRVVFLEGRLGEVESSFDEARREASKWKAECDRIRSWMQDELDGPC